MSVAVNLYVDRMSPVEPVRVADVYSVTSDRASIYKEAAAKMGLSAQEYTEFRQALTDGAAVYVRLPRHIDAMAGVHHRNHQVYVLRNVEVPGDTMGWEVALTDGATVIIPQICANLSLNRSHVVARKPVAAHKPAVVAMRKQPKAVRAVSYVAPAPAQVAATPVTFSAPEPVAPVAAFAGGSSSAVRTSALSFAGLIVPIAASFVGGGGGSTTTAPAFAPPCSAGSNTMGICAGK